MCHQLVPPPRQFQQKFTDFAFSLETEAGRRHFRWIKDIELERNIKRYQETDPVFCQWWQGQDEKALLQYFIDIWQDLARGEAERQLAKKHLAAYLEYPRYRAVEQRYETFRDFAAPEETWEKYQHISLVMAQNPDLITKFYHRYRGGKGLEMHFQLEIESEIREEYYRETGEGKYSDWYRLKNTSDRLLKQKLQELGRVDEWKIACCLKAKQALFAVYGKTGRQWMPPSGRHYQDAAAYFNRYYLPEIGEGSNLKQPISADKCEKWINRCLVALKLAPKCVSASQILSEEAEDGETIPPFSYSDPEQDLVAQEEAEKREKALEPLTELLAQKLSELEGENTNQIVLMLRYGLGLPDQAIGDQIGVHQTTVLYRRQQFHRELVRSLSDWVQCHHPDRALLELAALEDDIVAWLQSHYQSRLHPVLFAAFSRLDADSSEFLRQAYILETDLTDIALSYNVKVAAVKGQLASSLDQLSSELISWVDSNFGLSIGAKRKKVLAYVESWIRQVPESDILADI
ncbi:MAG TPA: hypothetical protein IGS52_11720 [Oscillatoriaceae cyanobacterium M33_DOE_052]|uniref:Sigma-70 family RNA polymerase sigma factor n=1 Tax=Planktothricoides sp. SpSt-374 TaxID=2282167 RepID=A0A7C3ZXV7_9CYAN|nr:hypothetical protein [Oscillatoriaceae cyanobacterium M33_DOE_052]